MIVRRRMGKRERRRKEKRGNEENKRGYGGTRKSEPKRKMGSYITAGRLEGDNKKVTLMNF